MLKREPESRKPKFEMLIDLINREFPSHKIIVDNTIVSVIRLKSISNQKLDYRVRFITDDFLFAAPDGDFNEKINEGIELAKRCLDHPPFEDLIYQGDIEIVKDSVTFKARKK
jgi:hypothetical protein